MDYYELIGTTPVKYRGCPKSLTKTLWKTQLDSPDLNDLQIIISTIFLGTDHNYSNSGSPVLFETMIFGGEFDQHQIRYNSYDRAYSGHLNCVNHIINNKLIIYTRTELFPDQEPKIVSEIVNKKFNFNLRT